MSIEMPHWEWMGPAKKMLHIDEGLRLKPYRCPAGFLTIGVGHNLDADGISENAAAFILEEDIAECVKAAREIFSPVVFDEQFGNYQQLAIINLIFNLGIAGFKKFKKAIAAMKARDWKEAVNHIKFNAPGVPTKYYKQIPQRCERVCTMLLGEDFPY